MSEKDAKGILGAFTEIVDRLSAAAVQIEKRLALFEERSGPFSGDVRRVTAEVDTPPPAPGVQTVTPLAPPAGAAPREPEGERRPADPEHHFEVEAPPGGRIIASFAAPAGPSTREAELERRLQQAESQLAELRAEACRPTPPPAPAPARKTLPAIATSLLAKAGLHSVESIDAGTLDAALTGLSLEQRIAVKSQLFRAGALV